MKAKEIKKEQVVEETKAEETVEVTEVHVGDFEELKNETEKVKFKDKHPRAAKAIKLIGAIGAAIGIGAVGYAMGKSKNEDPLMIDSENDNEEDGLLQLTADIDESSDSSELEITEF